MFMLLLGMLTEDEVDSLYRLGQVMGDVRRDRDGGHVIITEGISTMTPWQ